MSPAIAIATVLTVFALPSGLASILASFNDRQRGYALPLLLAAIAAEGVALLIA